MPEDKFKDAAWKIINNYSTQNQLSEDEEVEKILEQTLTEIERIMKNKLKREITVKNLDDDTNHKLNKRDIRRESSFGILSPVQGDFLSQIFTQINRQQQQADDKAVLSGMYLKLFNRLDTAKLNPFIGYLAEPNEIGKRKFAIAIRW